MRARWLAMATLLASMPLAADDSTATGQATDEERLRQAPPDVAAAKSVESDQPVEEVVVTERRISNLTHKDRKRIYEELATARRLYSQNEIEKAFPYLLNTAEHGFKESQARVGHIYLRGLGEVERDSEQAVGWLGVASAGTTSPSIRNYFNGIWKRIPDRYVPHFEEVVEEYRTRYGEQATGVVCEMYRPARSYVKQLGCFFEEELSDQIREDIERYRNERAIRDQLDEQTRRAREFMERQDLLGDESQ